MRGIAEGIGWFVIVSFIAGSVGACDFKLCLSESGTCQMTKTTKKAKP